MKTRLFLFIAICIATVNVHAGRSNCQVNAPAINCFQFQLHRHCQRYGCGFYTTCLLLRPPTNATLSGFLQSAPIRIAGNTEADDRYEYRWS